jgi:hypothetical protein
MVVNAAPNEGDDPCAAAVSARPGVAMSDEVRTALLAALRHGSDCPTCRDGLSCVEGRRLGEDVAWLLRAHGHTTDPGQGGGG